MRSTPEHLLVYDPAKFDRCELVLIADGRERAGGGRASYKKMFDHLAKFGVTFETRALSVGDYLWVMRLDDGREMVMDYVIERKTWDDLKVLISFSVFMTLTRFHSVNCTFHFFSKASDTPVTRSRRSALRTVGFRM